MDGCLIDGAVCLLSNLFATKSEGGGIFFSSDREFKI